MADIENVKQGLRCCQHLDCQEECPYFTDCNELQDSMFTGIAHDALSVIEELQAENERLCKKIGVMKESIEDAIMSETVFDTFDDLSSYVNAERCRSEDWTGGIRDAIQAVRAWGE